MQSAYFREKLKEISPFSFYNLAIKVKALISFT